MALVARRLREGDAADFRDIRLMGLREAPEAFGSTYEAESGRSVPDFATTLTRGHVGGVHVDGALLGVAGFYVLDGTKTSHRGNIWGVYVRPESRGTGVGRALLEHLIAEAAIKVEQLHLSVVTENAAAIGLYERLGFRIYGTEPRSLLVDGRYYDEHLMVRMLK
jgi:ribosomal protein S18 acetylase RimI-like enzyme